MADVLRRFITGKISKCSISSPNNYGKYSAHIDGRFEDTGAPVNKFFVCKRQPTVYEGDKSPIDPKETDNLVFEGRMMVGQGTDDDTGDQFYWVEALSIEKRLETVEAPEPKEEGNPFLNNPRKSNF